MTQNAVYYAPTEAKFHWTNVIYQLIQARLLSISQNFGGKEYSEIYKLLLFVNPENWLANE